MEETYKLKSTLNNEEYDSEIPIALVESFNRLKEGMFAVSMGKFECTPIIYDPEYKGISCGILENKFNTTTEPMISDLYKIEIGGKYQTKLKWKLNIK